VKNLTYKKRYVKKNPIKNFIKTIFLDMSDSDSPEPIPFKG